MGEPLRILKQEPLSVVSAEPFRPVPARGEATLSDVITGNLPKKPAPIPPSAVLAHTLAGAPGVGLWSKLPQFLTDAADVVVGPALRAAPAIGGGILGGALGGPVGAALGGAAGAGMGEAGAEGVEVLANERESLNPLQIVAQSALGAIPTGGATSTVIGTAAKRAVQGGVLSGAGRAVTDLAEGQTPEVGSVLKDAAIGAVLGGTMGAAEGHFGGRSAKPAAAPKPAPELTITKTEPFDAAGRELGGYAGPERRGAGRETTAEANDVYARMREKLARGEQVGSAENRALGQQKSELESFREASAAARGEDTVRGPKPGMVRMYHGGADDGSDGARWFSSDRKYAEGYAEKSGGKVSFVDVPENHPLIASEYPEQSISKGFHQNVELPPELASQRKPLSGAPLPRTAAETPVMAAAEKPSDAVTASDVQPVQETKPFINNEQPAPVAPEQTPPMFERRPAVEAPGVPAQKPLSADRIAGDQKFLDKQPEPFREPLGAILEENRHFEAQRRGVQPVERTNALARYVQTERQALLPKGTALNAEELKAYSDNIATVTDRIDDLAKRVTAGVATPVERAALEKARIEQHVLLANAFGARAESGRALNIQKQFAQIFQSKDALALEAAMKVPGVNIEEVSAKLATLGTDAEKLDYLRSLTKHSPLDMARSVYYANILSGLRTHIRNIFGNTTNLAFHAASQGPAVAFDAARSAVTGQKRSIYLSELKPQAVGAVMGIKQGIDDALFTVKHGYTPKALGTFDVPRPELPGGGKNPFNWVGRTLEAEDQLFYGINYNRELYGRLYAKARGQGLTGEKLVNQIADWKLNPPREIAAAADKAALHAVFKEDPGKWVEGILAAKKNIPWLDFVMPFVKTPGNIIRQGIEATPAALVTQQTRNALAKGGRESAEAVGRAATGTAALAALAYWAANGKISGTGPTDPEERAALMESGWRPNSVQVGKNWYSFDQIQPLAQPLYAIANAFDSYRAEGKVDPGKVVGAVGKAMIDQSFLSGVSDLNNAMSDPDRYFEQFASRMVQGAVPFSGMARNITQAVDQTVREPKGAADAVKSVIPGVSKSVDPKLDRMGSEVKRTGGAAAQLTPFNIGTPSTDPVIQELTRLKVNTLGLPPKSLPATKTSPKIELSVDDRKKIGQAVKQELQRLFNNPGWQRLDEDAMRSQISQAAERARTRVAREIRLSRRPQ